MPGVMSKTHDDPGEARAVWLRVLRPGLGLKRWVLLFVAGVTVAGLGIALFVRYLYTIRAWPPAFYWLTLHFLPDWARGSLLLGDAGLLRGRRATTHHGREDQLRPLCAEVVTDQRVVDTGNVVTAAGVTSGIDLGLHLVGRFWGQAARDRIAAQMEWR